MQRQDEMERMNVLLSARNSFVATTIVLMSLIFFLIYKGDYPNVLVIIQSVMSVSFFGSLIFYRNKREGKDTFGAIMPIAIIMLVVGVIVLVGYLLMK